MAHFFKVYNYLHAIKTLHYPTLESIKDELHFKSIPLSRSSFFEIKNHIADRYGIEIELDKSNNTYHISKESENNLAEFLSLAGIIHRGELVKSVFDTKSELREKIFFEDVGKVKGVEHLEAVLDAIIMKQKISIEYKKYGSEETKKLRNMEPHFLKEHNGRFYIISYIPWGDNVITNAIDSRLVSVTKENEFFDPKPDELFHEYKHVVGLNYNQAKDEYEIYEPIEVLFEVSNYQLPYLTDLPLHATQKPTGKSSISNQGKADERTWYEYSLTVYPNYELMQKFLSMGREVIVKSPKPFVNDLVRHLDWMRERYGK